MHIFTFSVTHLLFVILNVLQACRVPKCDVIKFPFLHFSVFMTIPEEHDGKPSHTKFCMNWLAWSTRIATPDGVCQPGVGIISRY